MIEGDEYNAAYFDRGPKFLHYRPETVILTSVEYDHADLYPDPESLVAAYTHLVEIVPEDGLVVACGDSAAVLEVAANARCEVVSYGLGPSNDVSPTGDVTSVPEGVLRGGEPPSVAARLPDRRCPAQRRERPAARLIAGHAP